MDERNAPILTTPPRPSPGYDLDDLIFREDPWLASDR